MKKYGLLIALPVAAIVVILTVWYVSKNNNKDTVRPPYEIGNVRIDAGSFSLTESDTSVLEEFLAMDSYYFGGKNYLDRMEEMSTEIFASDSPDKGNYKKRMKAFEKLREDEIYLKGSVMAEIQNVSETEGSKTIEMLVIHSLGYGFAPDYKVTKKRLIQMTYTLVLSSDGKKMQIQSVTPGEDNPF